MSGRGRGRGRGGWRGGRAGRGAFPGLTDDDGNQVLVDKENGPPQRYPEVDLNAPDEPGPLDQLLIEYQEELHGLYKRSPYYIEKPADKAKDFDDKITRYTDKYETKVKRRKPPLVTYLTLHPALFPAELTSDKAKEISAHAAKSGAKIIQDGESTKVNNLALQRILAERVEQERRGGGVAGGEGAEAAGPGDEEDEEAGVGEPEDDNFDMEDEEAPHDHYAGFDDDEEYGDASDGGGDYEATY